jgi:hypothetical protein
LWWLVRMRMKPDAAFTPLDVANILPGFEGRTPRRYTGDDTATAQPAPWIEAMLE